MIFAFQKPLFKSPSSPVEVLIKQMSSLLLENLEVTTDVDEILPAPNLESCSILSHFDKFMSQKKMHEVLKMSEAVSQMCKQDNVARLVDVGSGKAYLSQVVAALQKDVEILAIDSQSLNLKGAQKRSNNLKVRN